MVLQENQQGLVLLRLVESTLETWLESTLADTHTIVVTGTRFANPAQWRFLNLLEESAAYLFQLIPFRTSERKLHR